MLTVHHEVVSHLVVCTAIIRVHRTKRIVVGKYKVVPNLPGRWNDRSFPCADGGYIRPSVCGRNV
jgi:hypothetical protein